MTFSFRVEQRQLIPLTDMERTEGGARAGLWREHQAGTRNVDIHTWGYTLIDVVKVGEPEDMMREFS